MNCTTKTYMSPQDAVKPRLSERVYSWNRTALTVMALLLVVTSLLCCTAPSHGYSLRRIIINRSSPAVIHGRGVQWSSRPVIFTSSSRSRSRGTLAAVANSDGNIISPFDASREVSTLDPLKSFQLCSSRPSLVWHVGRKHESEPDRRGR